MDRGRHVKVSVVVPAYNCAATIRATLDSVLGQTCPAEEILVMDDGSTDDTNSILESYRSSIRAFRQPNAGISGARDALIEKAKGELVAFVDSDDIWHPGYLEAQQMLYERYPKAAALFTGHRVFHGSGPLNWTGDPFDIPLATELIEPLKFLKRYNETPGFFYPSFCCVPIHVLKAMGSEPFRGRVAEDCYFCNRLALFGPVARTPTPLVGYRIREESVSSEVVRLCEGAVRSFERLEEQFRNCPDADYRSAFQRAYAVRRRDYAKVLLGAKMVSEGRQQLRRSLATSRAPLSVAKSLRLLLLTYMPDRLQPVWPVRVRH